jgi:hypothetical protein
VKEEEELFENRGAGEKITEEKRRRKREPPLFFLSFATSSTTVNLSPFFSPCCNTREEEKAGTSAHTGKTVADIAHHRKEKSSSLRHYAPSSLRQQQ